MGVYQLAKYTNLRNSTTLLHICRAFERAAHIHTENGEQKKGERQSNQSRRLV